MRRIRVFAIYVVIAVALFAPAAQAQEKPAAAPAPAAAAAAKAAEPAEGIEPAAADVLRKMSDYLSKAPFLRLDIADTMDLMDSDGAMIQYAHERTILIARPNKMHAMVEGDLRKDAVFYDGANLTVWNPSANVYAQIAAPPTIDGLLDDLRTKFGLDLPGADLIRGNLYDVVQSAALTGRYVGLHPIAGVPCHHLLIAGPKADWQLWIDAGEKPILRKVVIYYRDRPGKPQCTMLIKTIETPASIAPESFQFEPPASAQKIPFHPLDNKAGGTAPAKKEASDVNK